MKLFPNLFLIIFIILTTSSAYSIENTKDIRKVSDNAMEFVDKDNISGLFDYLKAYWPIPAAEIDVAKEQTISQRLMVKKRFGKKLGVEYIKTESVAETITRLTYIEKFSNHIVRWQLIFYKPQNKWILNSFHWDDKMQELF